MNSKLPLLMLVTVFLSACGGGSSSAPADGSVSSESIALAKIDSPVAKCLLGVSTQGVEGSGFTHKIQGVLSAVGDGSVTVSNITYDASHAVVFVNGVCATLADLRIGVTVTVDGPVDDATQTGTAFAIYADDSVVGRIDTIDTAAGTLSVSGQLTMVTPATVFADDIEPAQINTLKQGDMIGVSGSMQTDGTLLATHIQRWPANAFYGVAGVVTSVDAARHLLYVGGVAVLYDDAALVDFPDDMIRPGDYVRALGNPLGIRVGFSGATGITAWVIQHVAIPAPDPRNDIVLSGAISLVRGRDDFDVMGQPVKTTQTTRSGGLLMDLVNWGSAGVFVTVFGTLDPSGYVIAKLVVMQNGAPLLITGPITSIDSSTRTVNIIGVPVRLSGSYSYLERANGQGPAIGFDALHVGDQLAIEGSPLDNGLIDGLIARQGAPSTSVAINGWGWNPGASHKPIIVLTHGIRADTTNASFYWGHPLGAGCSCALSSGDAFWNYKMFSFLEVQVDGTWTGDHIEATKVYWLDE